LHLGFFNSRSVKGSVGSRSESRRQRRPKSEARILCCMLAVAGILFVGGALLGNAVSVLLSLFAALACATRVEQKYRNGDYGKVEDENVG
jgi:hypothetical protein